MGGWVGGWVEGVGKISRESFHSKFIRDHEGTQKRNKGGGRGRGASFKARIFHHLSGKPGKIARESLAAIVSAPLANTHVVTPSHLI